MNIKVYEFNNLSFEEMNELYENLLSSFILHKSVNPDLTFKLRRVWENSERTEGLIRLKILKLGIEAN